MSTEDFDLEKPHPLDLPTPKYVASSGFFMCDANNKPAEETYDILAKALLDAPNKVLVVNGNILIDQVRIVEGTIAGHVARTGGLDGFTDEPIWIYLGGFDVRTFKTDKLIFVNEPDDEPYPVKYQMQCHWCGCGRTYDTMKDVKRAGWIPIEDPLKSSWWFCPNEDCQEMALQYKEMFARCE